jgi:hypothetical protein
VCIAWIVGSVDIFELHRDLSMYKVWRDKKDKVTKIVIDPWEKKAA